MSDVMIEARELGRTFGATRALDDISFRMEKGRVLCLLGHNGAGKSTLVSILATVLPPTKGSARVAGFDVVREARDVRRRIGLTGQFAAVDESLTGRANLLLVARLLGAGKKEAAARAEQLLEMFALTDAADRAAGTYSGGMRRRLDLASSFVGRPQVLFLDEPTTGLDPVSRGALWDLVREVVGAGTTLLLTTQYLEEADQLADRVMVLSRGTCIADGSVAQLKEQLGGSTVQATLADPRATTAALNALRAAGLDPCPGGSAGTVTAAVEGSIGLAAAVRAFDAAGVEITGISLSEPTLDDVYLALAAPRTGVPVPS